MAVEPITDSSNVTPTVIAKLIARSFIGHDIAISTKLLGSSPQSGKTVSTSTGPRTRAWHASRVRGLIDRCHRKENLSAGRIGVRFSAPDCTTTRQVAHNVRAPQTCIRRISFFSAAPRSVPPTRISILRPSISMGTASGRAAASLSLFAKARFSSGSLVPLTGRATNFISAASFDSSSFGFIEILQAASEAFFARAPAAIPPRAR